MSDMATTLPARPPAADLLDKKMKKSHAMISGGVCIAALVIGIGYIGVSVAKDFSGVALGSIWPYALLNSISLCLLGSVSADSHCRTPQHRRPRRYQLAEPLAGKRPTGAYPGHL
jgi:hypothetical protein